MQAQDDPFGTGANVFGENEANDESAIADQPQTDSSGTALPPLPADANIVVRMLRDEPPKGFSELGRAVKLMYRLQEWSELGRYLDQLAPLVTSDQIAETLTNQQGSDLWLRLSLQGELTFEQRKTAEKVLELVSKSQLAPTAIGQSIEGLKSTDPVIRKRSAMQIQRTGVYGLQTLVMSIANDGLPASPIVLDLINSFGQSGVDALTAALDTQDQQQRERLLYASIAFVGKGLLPQLTLALHDTNTSDELKRSIAEVFSKRGRELPSISQTRRFLLEEISRDLNLARSTPIDSDLEALEPIWVWNQETKSIESVVAFGNTYFLQRAAEKSLAVLRCDTTIDKAAVLAMATLFQRDYAIDQYVRPGVLNLRTPEPIRNYSNWIAGRVADFGFWESIYKTAALNQLYAAQLRSIQHLGSLPEQSLINSDAVELLVDAAKSNIPAVRYSALETILRSNQLQAVPQLATQLQKAMLRQTQFVGYPTALVIGASPELRQTAISQLAELGIESIEAANGREAVLQIQRFAPLEYLFVVDRVRDMSLSEVIQRVAAYTPTSAIPIGVLTQNLTTGEAVVLQDTPRLVYGTLTERDNYMETIVRRMNCLADIPLPSRSDRLVWTGMLKASESN